MAAYIFLTFMLLQASLPKYGLQYFLETALKNNPSIKEYHQLVAGGKLQKEMISAQYASPIQFDSRIYMFEGRNPVEIIPLIGPSRKGTSVRMPIPSMVSAAPPVQVRFGFIAMRFERGIPALSLSEKI